MSSHHRTISRHVRRVVMIGGLSFAVACTPIARFHGFIPLPEDLAQLTVGVDTREKVLAITGPSASGGAVGDDTLYYVSSKFEQFGPFEPKEVDRQVVAISFNSAGTLSNIERFTLEDGRIVVLSRRITDDGIDDLTAIGQLLGSIGRIDAATVLGGPLGGIGDGSIGDDGS